MRTPASLLAAARLRAGITQRELARRARTAQSVVARIESGVTSPSWETLSRLLAETGHELDAPLSAKPVIDSHMMQDVSRILGLTPEARLSELANASRFLGAAEKKRARAVDG